MPTSECKLNQKKRSNGAQSANPDCIAEDQEFSTESIDNVIARLEKGY